MRAPSTKEVNGMYTQVVRTQVAATDFLDPSTYRDLGWKGVLFAFAVLSLVLAIKNKALWIVAMHANERGVREIFGIPMWQVKRGLHLDIAGVFKVRKTQIADFPVKLAGEVMVGNANDLDSYVITYSASCTLRVGATFEQLKAQIYNAKDTNRDNMENSSAEDLAATALEDAMRQLIQLRYDGDAVQAHLPTRAADKLNRYGYDVEEVNIGTFVIRPSSEVARAMRSSNTSSAVVGALLDESVPPDLRVL